MIDEFRGKYFFLSNFYREDDEGFTNEHRFQAMKADNLEACRRILMAETPGEAKRLGRRVNLRPDWEDVKLEAMEYCLRIKFEDPQLRQKLINTGDEKLVEGNKWGDEYWGVNLVTGKGENKLGKLLMKLREEYRVSSS